MKKFKFKSLFLLIITVFLSSCNDEKLDPALLVDNPNPQVDAIFSADFDGTTWNATAATAYISGNLIRIEGIKANGEGFSFIVSGNGVGTFPAKDNVVSYTPANSDFGYFAVNPAIPAENTGSVSITQINTATKTFSGDFNFKGYWSDGLTTTIPPIVFSNGVFLNIPYVILSPVADTFSAKVGLNEFIDNTISTSVFSLNNVELLSIEALNSSNNSMTITLDNNLPAGTYPITGNISNGVVKARYVQDNLIYLAESGSVTITSKTATRIVGTFHFFANGFPLEITEGQFDVAY